MAENEIYSGPDATRHSTSNTDMRLASEEWSSFQKMMFAKIREKKAKGVNIHDYDTSELVGIINLLSKICELQDEVIERVHWPKLDCATSRPSDERSFEQAFRHLHTKYMEPAQSVEMAWSVAFSAIRQYTEWSRSEHFSGMGIDLGAFFLAELDATLRVVMNDHISRATH